MKIQFILTDIIYIMKICKNIRVISMSILKKCFVFSTIRAQYLKSSWSLVKKNKYPNSSYLTILMQLIGSGVQLWSRQSKPDGKSEILFKEGISK